MEAMKKLCATGTHFQSVTGKEMEDRTVDVVQIYPEKVYSNGAGWGVFLAEVVDKESEV